MPACPLADAYRVSCCMLGRMSCGLAIYSSPVGCVNLLQVAEALMSASVTPGSCMVHIMLHAWNKVGWPCHTLITSWLCHLVAGG
jgi:hypothetical protein